MYKILTIVLMCISIIIDAQDNIKVVPQEFSEVIIPIITKDNIRIPKLKDLLEKSKNPKAKKNYSYTVTYIDAEKKYEIREEKKDHSEMNVYKFQDGVIFKVLKYKKDKQEFARKKIYFGGKATVISQQIQSQIDFYSNGNIHTIRHVHLNGNYPVGKWYAYAADGTLVQEIDHNNRFKLNYLDLMQIADSYEYPKIFVGRNFNDIHSYWYIILEPYNHKNTPVKKMLLLDDQTKEIIYDIQGPEETYLNSKQYEMLKLSKSSLDWLRENDHHQIPEKEFYRLFIE